MKLTRLRVAELRQFRQPFELAGLQPGLNLFAGANEAGKSTLVRAIRAAFFERHRSTAVDDLRPHGDSAAAPTVELDFEIAGTAYRLAKSFLQKKRCELVAGTRRLEGAEAEDHLAALLGFQFALKGASREEHWGIPGLLWIEQGQGQDVHKAVGHAGGHLQTALNESLGEVAASGGDEILSLVRTRRNELLGANGKPRQPLQQVIDAEQALRSEVAALLQAVQEYRDQVDTLRRLREAHAADQAAQPWVALRERQAQAQAALEATDGLARELAAGRERLRQAGGLCELLVQQLAQAERQRQDLAARETALQAAQHHHEQAQAAAQQAEAAQAAASGRLQHARDTLALARQEDTRKRLLRQLDDARTRAAEATSLLERARAEHERGAALHREALAGRIAPADLTRLRQQHEHLRELEIRQSAVATRLAFELEPGRTIELDGQPLQGRGERLLATPGTITLPGLGRLHVSPGGHDLAELARDHQAVRDQHHALLQRLGLPSLAEAEARDQLQRQKQADAAAATKALALIAPKGLDALQTDRDAARTRQTEAQAALAQLPPPAAEPPAPLATAEHTHEAQRAAADAASALAQQQREALTTAAGRHDAARQERDMLASALADPQRQQQLTAQQARLVEARAQAATLQQALGAIEAQIAARRPDILRQDVERLKLSAESAERAHRERELQIIQLESALQAAGAQGLEEALSLKEADLAQARRRSSELQRRARALDHLLQRLDARRQALTQRLQAPLQKHLDHYLPLLFPDGRLEVDGQLAPGALRRPGLRGPESVDFDTLSFGAKEQMGVIARLAYADLLKAAGRPTLLILDDALVHSDEVRLAQMKRVLFDAAQRHQVLLFTCHPDRWRDLGAPMRVLAPPGPPVGAPTLTTTQAPP